MEADPPAEQPNGSIGLVLIAIWILVFGPVGTHPGCIPPAGWWRL